MLRFFSVVGVFLLLIGTPAAAEDEASFLDLPLSWTVAVPAEIRDVLAGYEEGRFLEVLEKVKRIERSPRIERARDDARMIRALALVGLGWDEPATDVLRLLLATRPPSPYYPLALLELVEIHHRAGRPEDVASAYSRYFDGPWRGDDETSREIRKLLSEYGTLRSADAKLSPSEKQRLANAEELEVRLEERRERPTDRILYLVGTALLRTREYGKSLEALRRIGIESPYYPYALYTTALDQIALHNEADDSGIVGRLMSFEVDDSAVAVLQRLIRYPEVSSHEEALDGRARLLLARLLFRAGEIDEGIRVATTLPEGDPHAEEGRLLVAGTLLGREEPALALVYAGEAEEEDSGKAPPNGDLRSADVVAHRGLILGRAYTELGDRERAVRTYRAAMQQVKRDSSDGSTDRAAGRLRALAGVLVREEAARAARLRRHRARGIRQVLVYEGWGPWWSPGRIRRTVEETLGARPHGFLARGYEPESPSRVATDRLWFDFLGSPERKAVTAALERLFDLESGRNTGAMALRVLDGYLLWLANAGGVPEGEVSAVVQRTGRYVGELRRRHGFSLPPFDVDPEPVLPAEIDAYRGRWVDEGLPVPAKDSVGAAAVARADVSELLEDWADRGIRKFLEKRKRARQALELRLEKALARTLAREASGSPPKGTSGGTP